MKASFPSSVRPVFFFFSIYLGKAKSSLTLPPYFDQLSSQTHFRKSLSSPSAQPGMIRRLVHTPHPDQYPDLLNIYTSYPQPLDPANLISLVHTRTTAHTSTHTPPITRHTAKHQTTCCNPTCQEVHPPPPWKDTSRPAEVWILIVH